MMLRRMKRDGITVHGFRSSFRDWTGNISSFPREVTETALAHVIGDKAEQAYRRSDALEAIISEWVLHLRQNQLFGPDDPLFPQRRLWLAKRAF